MLQVAHHWWQHPGDKPGRFQLLDLQRPRVAGLLANTPWPIAGEHVPSRMLEAARAVSLAAFLDPAVACAALLERVQGSLKPFIGAAAWGSEDDWEASWDFGGDCAFVAQIGAEVALARVGNLRVVSLAADGTVRLLLREHTLDLPQHPVPTATIMTASLANQELPADAVWTGDLRAASWVLLGTPSVLELLDGCTLSQCLRERPFPQAADNVFAEVQALLRVKTAPSSALVIVELSSADLAPLENQ